MSPEKGWGKLLFTSSLSVFPNPKLILRIEKNLIENGDGLIRDAAQSSTLIKYELVRFGFNSYFSSTQHGKNEGFVSFFESHFALQLIVV